MTEYNSLRLAYNAAVEAKMSANLKEVEKIFREGEDTIWSKNSLTIPVRPSKPTQPAAYAGLRMYKTGTKKYEDVELSAQGGGGQTTVGLLKANYEGKSFGVFG